MSDIALYIYRLPPITKVFLHYSALVAFLNSILKDLYGVRHVLHAQVLDGGKLIPSRVRHSRSLW